MSNTVPRMTNLFLQLGLDASPEAIAQFIRANPLAEDVHILDAACWSEAQAAMLKEMLCSDGNWSLVVDQLSEAMRQGS